MINRPAKPLMRDPNTYLTLKGNRYLVVDLNRNQIIRGFGYTPQAKNNKGVIEKVSISTSKNGKKWSRVGDFEFGNIVNDPTHRIHYFQKPIKTKYIKINILKIANDDKVATIAELDFIR